MGVGSRADADGYHRGDYGLPRTPRQRFQVIVGAVLTQNTTWINAERALRDLLSEGIGTAQALMGCPPKKLARLIRASGYYNQKARKLLSLAPLLCAPGILSAKRPPSREALLSVWGIGPETADSILLYAFGIPFFVVDAYTRRLLGRMGLIEGTEGYDEIQGMFHASYGWDPVLFNEYHALIVEHSKGTCRAKPMCKECSLRIQFNCPYGKRRALRDGAYRAAGAIRNSQRLLP